MQAVLTAPFPTRRSPFRPAVDAPAPFAAPSLALLAGMRLIYIDDDAQLSFLVRHFLARRGVWVEAFSDARQGLQVLRDAPYAFDLLLTDYNMPVMNGLDVIRVAQALNPKLKVALASGDVTDAMEQEAATLGLTEVIVKPATMESYVGSIEAYFLRRQDNG